MKPCFNHAASMQTRYWSNYLDIEQKLFDETCILHARVFARKCVVQFFEGMREDVWVRLPRPLVRSREEEEEEEEQERLHGITRQDQVDHILNAWHMCKPELDVTKIAYWPKVYVTWEDREGKTLFSDV